MKRLFSSILALAIVFIAVESRAQVVISGAANVFSNSTYATPVSSPFVVSAPSHTYSINHNGLLATTNFSAYRRIGLVDAITGVTNYTTVQQWTAASTSAATETPTFTNFNFLVYEQLQLTTTNAMNIPTSVGAATYVTNTIVY